VAKTARAYWLYHSASAASIRAAMVGTRGSRRTKANGRGVVAKERPIDDALVDWVVAQQQAAFVVTEAAAFYISAYPDYLQQHDSICSWWLEVKATPEDEIRSVHPDVRVYFRKDLYWQTVATLVDSFLASGARETPNAVKNAYALNLPPPSSNVIMQCLSGCVAKRLFRCSTDLVSQWPVILLDSVIRYEATPLHAPAPSPTGEKFICGRMGNWFSEIAIRSGPAFDPFTWNDAAFLAIESKGIFRRKTTFDDLTQQVLTHGASCITVS